MKKNFLLILCFAFCTASQAQQKKASPKKEFNIETAFSLAKTLVNTDNYSGNDTAAREILGGMLWYLNGDGEIKIPEAIKLIDSQYIKLQPYFEKLTGQLIKGDVFSVKTAFLEECMQQNFKKGKSSLEGCYADFLKHKKEYDSLQQLRSSLEKEKNINRKNRVFVDTSIALKKVRLQEAILTTADSSNKNQLMKELAEFTDLQNKLKKDIDSLEGRISNLVITIRQLKGQIERLPCLKEIELACNANVPDGQRTGLLSDPGEELAVYNSRVSNTEYIFNSADLSPLSFRLPSQSDIIDALAIYLAKRVKQESVMWFFETLQRNAKLYELVKTFFPETILLLNSKEVFEIPNLGAAWRYALSKDFIYMPRNVFKSEWLKSKLGKDADRITEALSLSWEIARMVEQKYNYNDIIASIYLQHTEPGSGDKISLGDLVSVLYAINNELIKKKGSGFSWLKFEELLYMSDEEFQVMLSLMDARYHHVFSKLTIPSGNKFFFDTKKLSELRRWLGLVLLKVNQIDKLRDQYKTFVATTKEGLEKFEYSDYNTWKFLQDLLKTIQVNNSGETTGKVFRQFDAVLTKTLNALIQVQEVYSLLQKKNFAGAVDVILHTIDSLSGSDYLRISQKYFEQSAELKRAITSADLKSFIVREKNQVFYHIPDSLVQYIIVKRNDQKAVKIIRNLAGFLNDVAQAENSKALSKVVESYAMPPGSYKRKRNSWKSVDLAAYVGLYGGYETATTKTEGQKNSGTVYGITAPIGLSASKTFGLKKNDGFKNMDLTNPDIFKISKGKIWQRTQTTLTAFLSIIDIGAVVSYRFSNQDTVLPQKIKWAQVISPGFHLNIGIKGTPLVFSAGLQHTPQLRKFKQDNEQRNALRFYGGVLFDIPLFNLWTKSDVVRK